jgi:hypothetical protein
LSLPGNKEKAMKTYQHIDGEVSYAEAPDEIVKAIQRRLGSRDVVKCNCGDDCYRYDPSNWWDGATHVYYDGEGNFKFDGWGGPQRFVMIGPLN